MVYGTPPLDALDQFHDAGDLSRHSIFDTYFSQHGFQFTAGDTTTTYNTQDDPGGTLFDTSGSGSYYAQFDVDVSGLDSGFGLHFDLYNTDVLMDGDIDRDDFAPYSHDAEILRPPGPGPGPGPGGPGPGPGTSIPEPGTLFLLGSGLAALLGSKGRKRQS